MSWLLPERVARARELYRLGLRVRKPVAREVLFAAALAGLGETGTPDRRTVRQAIRASIPAATRRRRWIAVALAGVALAAAVAWVFVLDPFWYRDQLRGARFTVSSAYPGYPREGAVIGVRGALFHTVSEDHPWVELDLGEPRTLSRMRVVNRDQARGRAVPLVVEGSLDRVHWRELGRRHDPFRVWRFDLPGGPFRYFRLSVPRTTFFHLASIAAY
jgi:F5/8 type C domain